ncbi:MAG: dolichol kinase [Bacteroidota bacterium]
MTATLDKGNIDYKSELLRKSIHLLSLSMAIIYYFISRELALQILVPLTIFSLILDLSRYIFPSYSKLFYKLFGFMLREHEINSKKLTLSGATYVFFGVTLVVIFFPKVFVIPAIAILIIGDISAALFGRKFGRHKFLAKSLEGTFAFFITGSIVILFSPKVSGELLEYLIGFAAAAVGSIMENVSYGWADDNLTVPLAVCLTMAALYSIFLPDMILILPNVPV